MTPTTAPFMNFQQKFTLPYLIRQSVLFIGKFSYQNVGTGFRYLRNLDNLVNGSCGDSGVKGQFRLRLKIHICKDDDKCNVCESDGCYYESEYYYEYPLMVSKCYVIQLPVTSFKCCFIIQAFSYIIQMLFHYSSIQLHCPNAVSLFKHSVTLSKCCFITQAFSYII